VLIGGVIFSNVAFIVDYAGVAATDNRDASVVDAIVDDATVANDVNHRCTLQFSCLPFL
jgi:hypothetical protein